MLCDSGAVRRAAHRAELPACPVSGAGPADCPQPEPLGRGGEPHMVMFEVYGKTGCAKCKSTRNKLTHLIAKSDRTAEVDLTYHDMDTVDGMAEGAFNDVTDIPTTILRSDAGEALARWEGWLPPSDEVKAYLARAPQA
jgi:hypothetical protein